MIVFILLLNSVSLLIA